MQHFLALRWVLDANTGSCYVRTIMKRSDIIQRRAELGLSQEDLARAVGTRQQTIHKIENGRTKFSRYLPKIEAILGISADSAQHHEVQKAGMGASPLVGEHDLPVYGAAECGDGAIIMSSDPIDYVGRPQPLANVRDGYGVLVVGDSMVPAFEPGDIALIHPHLPPVRDCDVLLLGQDSQGRDVATIKRLVRFTATEWHLRQWNPPSADAADFALSRKKWPTCHRIVGKYSRR